MKICKRGLHRLQVYNYEGDVRICGWLKDDYIGNLIENTLDEIYNGSRLRRIQKLLAEQNYSECKIDACPWLARGTINDILEDIDGWPEHPEEIQIGFERICNYVCSSCGISGHMKTCDWKKAEINAQKIESRLREALPYLKRIGANGCGELFVSKHTLQLLADWRPLAAPEDCEVQLETNGSLFDAEHWKQIENIGQYKVMVYITLMSFNEKTYQLLSGTKLPVEQVIENLHFVKKLRDKGVINHLEIATVVQERNFREMPEFTRRCLEEFKADSVRLRPYEPWHSRDEITEWFTDVRGGEHPYHKEWREVMSDPVFKHPRVFDGSGDRDSEIGEFPLKKQIRNFKEKNRILGSLLLSDKFDIYVRNLSEQEMLVYGIGDIGKKVVQVLRKHGKSCYVLDRYSQVQEYEGTRVVHPEELDKTLRDRNVIVTTVNNKDNVMEFLKNHEYTGRLFFIQIIL